MEGEKRDDNTKNTKNKKNRRGFLKDGKMVREKRKLEMWKMEDQKDLL